MKTVKSLALVLWLGVSASYASVNSASDARRLIAPLQGACQAAGVNADLRQCLATAGDAKARRDCLRAADSATVTVAGVERADARVATAREQFAPAGDLLAQKLDVDLERVTDVVSTSPLPALTGVADDFVNTLVPSLLEANAGLNEPQTLGLSVVLPRFMGLKLKLGGYSNPEAELNPVLETTLLERGQLASFREKEQRLDIGDDYYLSVDVAVLGRWFGRDPRDHGLEQSRLAWQMMAGTTPRGQDLPSRHFQNAAMWLANDPGFSASDIGTIDCAYFHYQQAREQERAGIARGGLNDFWRLVHHQPQWIMGYRRLHRDELVGADSRIYKLKFSSGLFNNVNFLRWTSRCDNDLSGPRCPEAMQDMQQSFAMRYGLGMALYYEQGELADIRVDLPEATSPTSALLPPLVQEQLVGEDDVFRLDGGDYRRYGWSVGAELIPMSSTPGDNKASLRVDAGMDYYRYDRDLLRVDHDVSRITLTYRRGRFSFPFHLMYRSETEFEADLGQDLVLGIGVQSSFSQW